MGFSEIILILDILSLFFNNTVKGSDVYISKHDHHMSS